MKTQKVALITGSGSGLGKELALEFSKKNYNLVLSGRDANKLEAVRQQIVKNKVKCILVAGDITKKEVREKLFSEALKKYGRIDVLVNNAGIFSEKLLDDVTEEEIDNIIEVNTTAHIKLSKLFYKHMKAKKSGKIVNIVSINAITPRENRVIYCSSKAAMKGFTESFRMEANKNNVQVFGVYPGGMQTDIFKNAGLERDTSNYTKPAEIAKTIVNAVDGQEESTSDLIFYRMKF